ncbi:contractile injection system tape measure protein [Dysgonomonas sp. 25]|uniref:contractile injection system tape measure protein n=1 Tax=Dysgonomonas sp. 25 TaxID=2302933 RepID=UPI0013D3D95B|nr:contractile injection system tape measure protein [Dysgonomonas sp. 25]NDV67378.1 hypothetical protein [Dysgonomonas sp. 25]
MNTIGKIAFDFKTENEEFTRSLYERWDNFFALNVEKIIDSVLEKYDKKDSVIEISRIELDLEQIEEENFDEHFPLLLRERLEEALLQYLNNTNNKQSNQQTEKDYLFTILCHFLLHGYLPWHIEDKYKNICELFLVVLKDNSERLKTFLLTYGHYTSLQERLVYQLDEPLLEKGIYLLAPDESAFICSYIHFLKEKYITLDKAYIQQSNYRNTVYLVVYSYLLTNRSSFFNKKSFIISTINGLAKKYNLTYDYLLILFYQNNVLENVRLPFDLIQVFEQLKQDYKLTSQKDQPIPETRDEKLQENAKKTLEKYFGKEANFSDIILRLSEETDFIKFIDEILQIENLLYRFISSELNITINRKKILNLLLKLSAEYRYLSQEDILSRIVDLIARDIDTSKQPLFFEKIESFFQTNKLLKSYSNIINHKNEIIMEKQNLNIPQNEPIYVDNAGIVLLTPYFPRLFSLMSLTEDRKFKGEAEQLRALATTYYLVTGNDRSPKEQYIINKLLVGMDISKPIPQLPELTKEDKEVCESLLKAVLQNWDKLRNTSIMALREAFLMRPGKVEMKEDAIHLRVEEKAYDMLLDSVPWNFRMIKMPWMEKRIEVKWR